MKRALKLFLEIFTERDKSNFMRSPNNHKKFIYV